MTIAIAAMSITTMTSPVDAAVATSITIMTSIADAAVGITRSPRRRSSRRCRLMCSLPYTSGNACR